MKIKPQRAQKDGERECRGAGEREKGKKGAIPRGCRCEALRQQSEAIPNGMASTIFPTYGPELFHHEGIQ